MRTTNQIGGFKRLKQSLSAWFFSLIVIMIALIPTWLYLLARYVFNPDNALVEILLFGVALYFLGFLQFILIILALLMIMEVIFNN